MRRWGCCGAGDVTARFDPEAATAAYLQAHAAECRVLDCVPDFSPWLVLVLPGVVLLTLALYLASGLAARTRDLAARLTSRRWLQESLYAIPLVLLFSIVVLPARYWLEHVVGLSNVARVRIRDQAGNWVDVGGARTPVDWLFDRASSLAFAVLLAAIAVPIVMALIRWLPRRYWMFPAVATSVWALLLFAHQPYSSATPLAAGSLREDVEAMARAAGQSPDRIMVGQQPFLRGGPIDAHILWWQGRPHVVVDDKLFNILPFDPEIISPPYRPVTAAEVRAVIGHELGHLQLGHLYFGPIVIVALLWLLCWLASIGARWILRACGARWRVQGVGDVAGVHQLAVDPGVLADFKARAAAA
jgi:hypothetical protein